MQEQIVIKSDNSIILTVPVMIPGAKDCDYWRGEDPFTVEQVRSFKEAYDDYGFIDKHHAVRGVQSAHKHHLIGNALKSFLLSEETSYSWVDGSIHTYPMGTWMITTEVNDPVAIKQVRDGEITGASPSIFTRETAEKIKAALKSDASLKASAGNLIKNINDPVPVLVSLVRKPCQHGNKFCESKNGENMSEDKAQNKLNKIRGILGLEETKDYATKEDLDEIKESVSGVFKSDEFKEFLGGMINEAVAEAVKPLALKEDNSDDSTNNDDKKKEEDDAKDDDSTEDKSDDSKNDDKTDDKKKSMKSDSKSLPQHDKNPEDKKALKSDKAITMEVMGRDKRGRPLKN